MSQSAFFSKYGVFEDKFTLNFYVYSFHLTAVLEFNFFWIGSSKIPYKNPKNMCRRVYLCHKFSGTKLITYFLSFQLLLEYLIDATFR